MSVKTDYFLKALHVLAWIIFIGVSIEAGGFIFNMIFTLVYNPEGARRFWTEVDLSALYHHNSRDYVSITSLMIIVSVLKAIMFYTIVKFFHDKPYNLDQPFREPVRRFILNLAYIAFGISLFSYWGAGYTEGLVKQGVRIPDIQSLRMAGADVWLFMGIALLVIGQVFKKGIELQAENDLTV
jgi:hypothetical protein